MSLWIIWLIVALILLILELLTFAVASLCLSLGCVLAAIVAACGGSLTLQIIASIVGIIISFITVAPALRRYYQAHHRPETATNMDALIGRVGKVTAEVTRNADDKGRVQIDGDSWLAYTTSPDCPIHRGRQVIVEAYDSLIIRVRPVENDN